MRVIKSGNKKIVDAKAKAAAATAAVNSAKAELKAVVEKKKKIKDIIAAGREDIATIESATEAVNKELKKKRKDLDKVMESIGVNTELLKMAKDTAKAVLVDAKAGATVITKTAKAKVTTLERKLSRLNDELQDAKGSVFSLEKDKASLVHDITAAKLVVENLVEEGAELTRTNERLEEKKLKLKKEVDQLKLSRGSSLKQRDQARKTTDAVERRFEKIRTQIAALSAEKNELFGIIQKQKVEEEINRRALLAQNNRLKSIDKREADLDKALKEAGLK